MIIRIIITTTIIIDKEYLNIKKYLLNYFEGLE